MDRRAPRGGPVRGDAGRRTSVPAEFRPRLHRSRRQPGHFVGRVRLEAARRGLEDTGDGIDQIARDSGFGTPEAMRRAFIRASGVSPAGYRDRFRLAALLHQKGTPMEIAILLFDRFTALDAVGPYEALSRLPGRRGGLRRPAAGPGATTAASLCPRGRPGRRTRPPTSRWCPAAQARRTVRRRPGARWLRAPTRRAPGPRRSAPGR